MSTLYYGALNILAEPYETQAGTAFGAWQSIQTERTSPFIDGSAVTGDASGNREIKLLVSIQTKDRVALIAASEALIAEANRPSNTLKWVVDDANPIVYDTFRVKAPERSDDDSEQFFLRTYELTISALPFARSDTLQTPTATAAGVTIVDPSVTTSGLQSLTFSGDMSAGSTNGLPVHTAPGGGGTLVRADPNSYGLTAVSGCTITGTTIKTITFTGTTAEVVSGSVAATANFIQTFGVVWGNDNEGAGVGTRQVGLEFFNGATSLGVVWGAPSLAGSQNDKIMPRFVTAQAPATTTLAKYRLRFTGAVSGKHVAVNYTQSERNAAATVPGFFDVTPFPGGEYFLANPGNNASGGYAVQGGNEYFVLGSPVNASGGSAVRCWLYREDLGGGVPDGTYTTGPWTYGYTSTYTPGDDGYVAPTGTYYGGGADRTYELPEDTQKVNINHATHSGDNYFRTVTPNLTPTYTIEGTRTTFRLHSSGGKWSSWDYVPNAAENLSFAQGTWRSLVFTAASPNAVSAAGAADLAAVTAVSVDLTGYGGSSAAVWRLGPVSSGPPSGATTSTHGTVYTLDSIVGSAPAPASALLSASSALTDLVVMAVDASDGPPLLSITSNAATAPAPAAYNGVYSVLATRTDATAPTTPQLVITQKQGATTVATVTLNGVTRPGNHYVDFGTTPLPLVAVPDENVSVNFTFAITPTSANWGDILLLNVNSSLVMLEQIDPARKMVWIDVPEIVVGIGDVWVGTTTRADASAPMQAVTQSSPFTVKAPNVNLLVYSTAAAPSATLSYFPHYLDGLT